MPTISFSPQRRPIVQTLACLINYSAKKIIILCLEPLPTQKGNQHSSTQNDQKANHFIPALITILPTTTYEAFSTHAANLEPTPFLMDQQHELELSKVYNSSEVNNGSKIPEGLFSIFLLSEHLSCVFHFTQSRKRSPVSLLTFQIFGQAKARQNK